MAMLVSALLLGCSCSPQATESTDASTPGTRARGGGGALFGHAPRSPNSFNHFVNADASEVLLWTCPTSIVTGHFNEDSNLDMAVTATGRNAGTVVLLGDGNGEFLVASQGLIETGSSPWAIGAADLNDDNIPDLVVADAQDGEIHVLLGNGNGEFTAVGTPIVVGPVPIAMVVVDVNHDSVPDVVVLSAYEGTLYVLLSDGSAGLVNAPGSPIDVGPVAVFPDPAPAFESFEITPSSNRVGPVALTTGDFDQDENLDLVVVNVHSDMVHLLVGDGTGEFTSAAGSPFGVGEEPSAVVAADFNGDGALDLAVTNHADATISLLVGDGNGDFSLAAETRVQTPPSWRWLPASITAGDYDGDGRLDIAVANFNFQVEVWLGDGGGAFSHAAGSPYILTGVAFGSSPRFVTNGDFTGDGKPGLAVAGIGHADPSNSFLIVLLNKN